MNTRRTSALVLVVAMGLLFLPGSAPTEAQTVAQLTDFKSGMHGVPTLDDTGSVVFAATSADPFGTNPAPAWQIGEWDAATG